MPTADNDTLLIFRIAGIPCAVPAQSVDTIVMPPAHLTHPPGTGKSTPGIFQHSDQVHAVIDLHERFGIDTPRKGMGRLLLNHEGMRHYAFWVDEVVGLVRSEQGKWAALPPYLPRTLFWSGFLYRKEIVLCTRLDDLRRMRDAAPLHLHLATLQPTPEQEQVQTDANVARQREEKKEEPAPVMRQAAEAPSTIRDALKAKEPAAPKSAPPSINTVRTTPTRPVTKTRAHATKPLPSTTSRSSAQKGAYSATKPRPAITAGKPAEENATASKNTLPVMREVQAAPTQTTAQHEASASSLGSPSRLPWLFLIILLGLGGGYWLRPNTMPDMEGTAHPTPLQQTPSTAPASSSLATSPEAPAMPAPTEVLASAPQPVAPPEAPAEEVPVQHSGDRPLRIERDDEGTINLIIDRAAIKAQGSTATPPSPARNKSATSVENTGSTDLPIAPGPAESTLATTGSEAEEEKPLQPDPDWPTPITATVEPCDCTHIVVKGDTLWDIAQYYTKDAFNYHELARLSGIRNPDRIYPGDKVRIIIR